MLNNYKDLLAFQGLKIEDLIKQGYKYVISVIKHVLILTLSCDSKASIFDK